MPRRGGSRSYSGSRQRNQRCNRVYKQNTEPSRTTRPTRTAEDKRFRMPNSSGALSSGFTLPLVIGTYFLLFGAAQRRQQAVVHIQHNNDEQTVSHEEDEVEEIPQLPETDPCFKQFKSMMGCFEANGTENSECQSFIDLMEQCAKFNSQEEV